MALPPEKPKILIVDHQLENLQICQLLEPYLPPKHKQYV